LTASLIHEFHGASVTFEAGAAVSGVKLSSDVSSIQITGLSPGTQPSFIVDLLADLGFQIMESSVRVKSIGEEGLVAEVKIEDPTFAKVTSRNFETRPDKSVHTKICIKPITGSVATGALANRLQLSTVTCTWYKPFRIAWLVSRNNADARNAQRLLATGKILQRSPECSLQPGLRGSGFPCTLQIANLDSRTQKRDLEALLMELLRPQQITLRGPSYPLSDKRAAEIVEALLQSKGGLELFQLHVLPGSSKNKATAIFNDRDEAAEAVRSLNNTTVESFGSTKLFVGKCCLS
jgi:hypothetical protein